MDGHLPFLEWSPTNPKMVTLHKEVYYRPELQLQNRISRVTSFDQLRLAK